MTLRVGVTARRAVEQLEQLLHSLETNSRLPPQSWYTFTIGDLEVKLSALFDDECVASLIHTHRYLPIVTAETHYSHNPQLVHLVYREMESLRHRLEKLRSDYRRLATFLEDVRPAALVDSNVNLHCVGLNEFDWHELLGTKEQVRVVVPLAVVRELDRKAHEGGPHVIRRARRAAATLNRLLGDGDPDKPASFTAKGGQIATLEVPRDDLGRTRLYDTDEEVIDFGLFLKHASGDATRVVLLTLDLNMKIRARRAGLSVCMVPNSYLKPDEHERV